MTVKTMSVPLQDMLQEDLPNAYFIGSEQEGVKFYPPLEDIDSPGPYVDQVDGLFYCTHHPIESDNVGWIKARLNWTRSTTVATELFNATISLYGLMIDGVPQLIGEYITTVCPT
jgi:hypothetical protein